MIDWDENKVVMSFTVDQAAKLSGVSRTQLAAWDRNGFFQPTIFDDNRRRAYSRVYTFRDIASLRVLNCLRNESRVSLHELRAVKERLTHMGEDIWAKTTLFVLNRKVIFVNPKTHNKEEIVSGQGIVNIPLEIVTGQLRKDVEALRKRDKDSIGQIEQERGIAQSRPIISGTRISVGAIKNFSEAGYTIEQIIEEYPILTKRDVEAAIAFKNVA